jgi:peptidoglycan/LPS O-acetylase OafA/YrhL
MKRYRALDALRGVAAIAVVGFHLGQIRLFPEGAVPHGYLAVDFFFILSGLVVGHAYEDKLLKGALSARSFLWIRAVRLYPMALIGSLFGLLVLLLKWSTYPEKVDPLTQILVSGVLNGLMLPTFFGTALSHYELFPGDGPLWSIFFEMAINIAWGLVLVHLRTGTLVAITCVGATTLVMMALNSGTLNIGFDIPTFAGGFARVTFGFTLGTLFSRLGVHRVFPAIPFGTSFAAILLLLIFVVPHGVEIDIISTLLLMPFIVAFGASQQANGTFSQLLGELSYPLYAIHFPILLIISALHQTRLQAINSYALCCLAVTLCIVSSAIVYQFFDRPVRSFLMSRTQKSPLRETAT